MVHDEAPRSRKSSGLASFWGSVKGRCLYLTLKFCVVVAAGALFFKLHFKEKKHMTWIDAVYFAVVTSTSVGYGDLTPVSDHGKLFLVAYMFVSVTTVASIISGFIHVYVNTYVGDAITNILVESVTFVHKADVGNDGKICEAEYSEFISLGLSAARSLSFTIPVFL